MAHKDYDVDWGKAGKSGSEENWKYVWRRDRKNMTKDEELKLVEYVRQKNAHLADKTVPAGVFLEYKLTSENDRSVAVLQNAYNNRLSKKKKTIAEVDAWIRQRRIELELPVGPKAEIDYESSTAEDNCSKGRDLDDDEPEPCMSPGDYLALVVEEYGSVLQDTPEERELSDRVKNAKQIIEKLDEETAEAILLGVFRATLDIIVD